MYGLFSLFFEYYYIVLILQAICVFHSLRRGNQNNWIWLIIFLPLIGCLAYIFTEIIRKQHVNSLQEGVSNLVNPTRKIKNLEAKFKFTDTFANRIELANAYLEKGFYEKAIEFYEPALENGVLQSENVVKNLMRAYYHVGRFAEIIAIASKISNSSDFSKSEANLYYAVALENFGKSGEAEIEYKKMDHKFSNYEQRYAYGIFLSKMNRPQEAFDLFNTVVNEGEYLNKKEKGNSKFWIDQCRLELKKLGIAKKITSS